MSSIFSSPEVLYVIGQLGKGGAEKGLYLLLKHLYHTAMVVSLSTGGYWAGPIRALGYNVVELENSSHADARRLWKLTRLIQSHRPKIIHVIGDSLSGFYGRMAGLLNRHSPVIVSVLHDPARDSAWYRFAKRYALNRFVQLFLTNSSATRNYLMANLSVQPDKVMLIPNGIELAPPLPLFPPVVQTTLPGVCQTKVKVGIVSKFTLEKAPEVFVRAAEHVIQQISGVSFMYVGDGPMRPEVEKLCHTLHLENRLCLLGQRDDVPDLLRMMDIFVLSSCSEGMPNAVMEAMAAGLPCVVTDAGDCHRLIRDGENGFVVPIGNDELLAARIMQLAQDEALRCRMGKKSLELIQGYDIKVIVEKYREVYDLVLGPRAQA